MRTLNLSAQFIQSDIDNLWHSPIQGSDIYISEQSIHIIGTFQLISHLASGSKQGFCFSHNRVQMLDQEFTNFVQSV